MRKTTFLVAAATLFGGFALFASPGSAAPVGPGTLPASEALIVQAQMSEKRMMKRKMSKRQMMRKKKMMRNKKMMRSGSGM